MQKLTITDFLKLVLISMLLIWGFYIIKPFLALIVWGAILAIAIYPFYRERIFHKNKRRQRIKTIIFTTVVVAILFYPLYFLTSSLTSQAAEVINQVKNETIELPHPNEKLKSFPLGGQQLFEKWDAISKDLKTAFIENKEFLMDKSKMLFGGFTSFLSTILILIFSFILSVVFMSNANSLRETLTKFFNMVVGNKAEELITLINNTIINVVKGILLIAIMQAILTYLSFWIFDVPLSLLFTIIVFLFCLIQIPLIVSAIPIIILAFATLDSPTNAIIFSVITLIISILDNFLKPYFLSKGLKTPASIIFIGAIGGVIFHGLIGLFIGPVILSVLHMLYTSWVNKDEKYKDEMQ